MAQRDLLLREIEKIGILLRGILGQLKKKKDETESIASDNIENANKVLQEEIGFDLEYFITLDEASVSEYLMKFEGMTTMNTELLAEVIYKSSNEKKHLQKALLLLELCEKQDQTFSMERINKMKEIKNIIQLCV
ncbi:hypothetical protein EMN47_19095 [Prolixibacteraceae bacterium JC049]|nr:hypothetical protein [Prolixibacteraceae bacterium JC049]